MDSEALHGWLLKFGEDSTRLRTSVENFVDWIANGSTPWSDYCAFMSGRMIALDKQPFVCPVGVGEMWRRLFAKIVLKFTGPEATMECQDDQLCAVIKAGIDSAIHRVQALWDKIIASFSFFISRCNIVPNLDHDKFFISVPNGFSFQKKIGVVR